MPNQALGYSDHYETIVALVSYLAFCNQYSKGFNKTIDNATPKWLATYLGIEEDEVRIVLDRYNGLFRRSIERYDGQFRYSLMLRYAHRKYTEPDPPDVSEPLANEELFSLLDFISNRVKLEQEEKHHADNNRNQKIAMSIAALSALIAAAASIISALAV